MFVIELFVGGFADGIMRSGFYCDQKTDDDNNVVITIAIGRNDKGVTKYLTVKNCRSTALSLLERSKQAFGFQIVNADTGAVLFFAQDVEKRELLKVVAYA